jgi:signal transduction histidine kinase
LYLAFQIIKAHGGELAVESKEGEYTEFCIKIPV